MERKLIFLDIDGTLTEPGKNELPASAVDAVRRARANGLKVVLVTDSDDYKSRTIQPGPCKTLDQVIQVK